MEKRNYRLYTHLFLVLFLLTSSRFILASIQSQMYYRGDMNGWGSTAMSFRDLGTDSWLAIIQSDGNDTSSDFKFDNETNWADNDWSRGDNITVGNLTTWYSPNGGNSWFNEIDSKYYTFIIKDVASSTNSEGYVFEFDGAPVTISHFDDSGSGGDNTPLDFENANSLEFKIDCGVDEPPADQKFYVRYHFDADNVNGYIDFASANIIGTTTTAFDGSHYYALISAGKPGNASTVTYYTLTTESNITLNNSIADLATVYLDNNGGENYTNSINGESLSIEDSQDTPLDFRIFAIYPNPFNPETVIHYQMDISGDVTIQIFNISGELVETLYRGFSTPGEYQIRWTPQAVSSGVYVVQMTMGNHRYKKHITYIK